MNKHLPLTTCKSQWWAIKYSDISRLLTTFISVDSYVGGMSPTSFGRILCRALEKEKIS